MLAPQYAEFITEYAESIREREAFTGPGAARQPLTQQQDKEEEEDDSEAT